MKNLFLLMCLLIGFGLQAQDLANNNNVPKGKWYQPSPKLMKMLSNFSVSATIGTPSFSSQELGSLNLKKIAGVSVADINISYKTNTRFSFGISLVGSLGNCSTGYYNQENVFVSLGHEEEDDDSSDNDDPDDSDDDDDDCHDDDMSNLMGNVTVKLSEKLPFFIQGSGGYSFSSKAPVYAAMLGYNQKIFAGFGIIAGIRYSDVLYKTPTNAKSITPSHGFKTELGISWNF